MKSTHEIWRRSSKFNYHPTNHQHTYNDPKGQLHSNLSQKSEEHGEDNTKWLGGPTHKRMGLDYDQPILAQSGGQSTHNQG
jgi:hypothetical protein